MNDILAHQSPELTSLTAAPVAGESVENLRQTRSGTISILLYEKGLGLITDDADGKIYPFHCTACVHSVDGYESLFHRARVKFEIAPAKTRAYDHEGKKIPLDVSPEFKMAPGSVPMGLTAINVESVEEPSHEADWCVIQVGNAVDEILVGMG
jgi:hypothetical protein